MISHGNARDPLSELERLGHSIGEHASFPMAILEGDSIMRYVNSAFSRLVGQPRNELVGKALGHALPSRIEFGSAIERVFRTGASETLVEEDGSVNYASASFAIWPVVSDKSVVGVAVQISFVSKPHPDTVAMNEALVLGAVRQHEITEAGNKLNRHLRDEIRERKRVEEALRQAQAQLADRAIQLEASVAARTAELSASNKQLEALLYSIAHDLRAPLRAMQGYSALLVEQAGGSLTRAGVSYADRIDESAQYMDSLLGGLLAFNRISQQRMPLVAVAVGPVVDSVISRLRSEIDEKSVSIEWFGSSTTVMAHAPTLYQTLLSIVGNALKFARPGAPSVVKILTVDQATGFVRVWVEDNGVGISPNHQEQIFRLFTRLHGEKYPGTGIGLAIVQKGVERMGGRVGVESTLGEGSRFWFELRKA